MRGGNDIGAVRLPIERLHIELTNHCNFSCEFCPDSRMNRKRGFLEFESLKKILDEAAREGLARTIFFHVMGEPLLYQRLTEAVGYAGGKGLKTCVTTNGSLLTDGLIEGLSRAGLSRMIISLQTPDERTFRFRGAKAIDFREYREKVARAARKVLEGGSMDLSISFLSSPLRRLIFPVMPEVSIADKSAALRAHLMDWAVYILKGTAFEGELPGVEKRIKRAGSFREVSIHIAGRLRFDTRIMGDWAVHSLNHGVRARIGFCPGIQENIGVLWNGDVVFCCVDYEGRTVVGNINDSSIAECLGRERVQRAVRGFNRLMVVDPHCQRCMGDKNHLNAVVRQIGSIVYFKAFRRMFPRR